MEQSKDPFIALTANLRISQMRLPTITALTETVNTLQSSLKLPDITATGPAFAL